MRPRQPSAVPRDRRPWVAIALAALLPLVFMWPTLLAGRPLFRDDAALFVYPMYRAMGECLRAGQLYLWDPGQYSGLPALACGQTGQLYPPHLLAFRLLPWMTALHLGYWLHLALAMVGFVWVARGLGLGWKAAGLGALVYAFSGYQAAHLVHYNFVTAAAHLPLLLGATRLALRSNRARCWALLALEGALAFLCSHPQVFLMGLAVALLWLLTGGWWRGLDRPARRFPGLALAAATALLLVMPQLLPTLELARESRGVTAAETVGAEQFVTSYPFRALDLVRVVLPDLFGTAEANVIGGGPAFHETCAFIGGGALLLALVGLGVGRRQNGYLFVLSLVFVGAALMWAHNPLHQLLAHVPLLGSFRAMGRWAVLPMLASGLLVSFALQRWPHLSLRGQAAARRGVVLFLSLFCLALAALWLTFGTEGGRLALPGHLEASVPVRNMADAIYNSLTGWEALIVALGLAGVAIALLTWPAGRGLSWGRAVALALALGVPLWHFWQVTNRTVARDYYLGPRPQTAQAILQSGPGRVVHLPPELVCADDSWRTRPGSELIPADYLSRELLTPAIGTLFGLAYADGYKQGLVTPATLRWWDMVYRYSIQSFTGQVETSAETVRRVGTPAERMAKFHALCGVQYIVTPGETATSDLQLILDGPVRVYRYRQEHPRVWLAGRVWTVQDPADQLEAVKERGFDPHAEVVVDGPVQGLPATPAVGSATLVAESNLRLEVVTRCPQRALLVVADAWYPGWTASVDGQPQRLLRANGVNRAVALPAGEHRVEFRYRPSSWRNGLLLALAGLVLLGLLVLWPSARDDRNDG